ncbi:MAG TPA: hypothetical protein VMB34_01245 [Acetobacteraceae bacterium]|nr:hypothetical protein [Acetobacteraceae bacterium]
MHCRIVLTGLAATLAAPAIARAATDHIAFGLDRKAGAEYGSHYQAAATGIYARRSSPISTRLWPSHSAGP